MKKSLLLKRSLKTLGALTVLLLILFLFLLGPTAKFFIETIGSKAIGSKIEINSLAINPIKGTLVLKELSIANPEGFSQTNMVSLSNLSLVFDASSLFSSSLTVHNIQMDDPFFAFELNGETDNVTETTARALDFFNIDPDAPAKEKNPDEKTEPKRVIVEALAINNLQVLVAHTQDQALNFDLGFEKLGLSMTNGLTELNDLYISSPDRIETADLFTLKALTARLAPDSIYSDNIVIESIQITEPYAYIEQNNDTDTIVELLQIATKFTNHFAQETQPAAAQQTISSEAVAAPELTLGPIDLEEFRFHLVNIANPHLNTRIGLKAAHIDPETGDINLSNFYITNPEKLTQPYLFSLKEIAISLTPAFYKEPVIKLEELHIKQPHIALELNPTASTSTEFMEIAQGFIDRSPTYQIPQPAPAPSQPSAPKSAPIQLGNFLVDDIQIKLYDDTATNNTPAIARTIFGIESIQADLQRGELAINQIVIPNAKGFTATNILELAKIGITLDPTTIQSEQVEINDIQVIAPIINLEKTETSGNIATLKNKLMQFIPPASAPRIEAPATTPTEKPAPLLLSEQPVILHRLSVTNFAIHLKLPLTTNSPSMLSVANLSALNPLNLYDKNEDDEEEADIDAPLKLVSFAELSVEPLLGTAKLSDLHICNPPDFSRKDILNLKEFSIELDPDTLQADTLKIHDIQLLQPKVRYERHIVTDNLKELRREFEETILGHPPTDDATETALSTNAAPAQKVTIGRVLISKASVRAKLISGTPATPPIPLMTIELNDIGEESGGTSAGNATSEVLATFRESMMSQISAATGVAGNLIGGAADGALNILDGATDGAKGLFNKATNLFKSDDEESDAPTD